MLFVFTKGSCNLFTTRTKQNWGYVLPSRSFDRTKLEINQVNSEYQAEQESEHTNIHSFIPSCESNLIN